MRGVLADMAIKVEAATALVMRLARSFDLAAGDAQEEGRARLLTPAVKYWVCKTAPALVYEAMECLGGNGYVEENPLPRLYREAPVNAIWEGSGNVMCLDVLRALASEPALMSAVLDALGRETQGLPGASAAAMFIQEAFSGKEPEARARLAVGQLALLAAAAALRECAPAIAEIFARTRLHEPHAGMLGTSKLGSDEARDLLDRALPVG